MSLPVVSVVIPAWNSASFLPESIGSALRQTFESFELVVVDDGSTDASREVFEAFRNRVKVVRQENRGVASARNRGISESCGRYVAFLDADDVWLEDKLRIQVAVLEGPDNVGVTYSAFMETTSDLRPLKTSRDRHRVNLAADLLLGGNVVGTPSTVVCRRDLLQRVGGFDRALSTCADWDLWIRLAEVASFCYVDAPLVWYRHHCSNMSRNVRALESESTYLLERALAAQQRPAAFRRRVRARNYMVVAGSYFRAGAYGQFIRCAAESLRRDPLQARRLLGYPLRKLRGKAEAS